MASKSLVLAASLFAALCAGSGNPGHGASSSLGASGTRASTAAAWALARIDASGAWALVGTHQLPTVAILDTGIDSAHPDLAGKVAAARDFVDGSGDTSDVSWHGTAVAGVVAGGSVESGTSVCPTCTIISAKVLDAEETGSDPEIARGLLWAVGAGVRVVNLSLSGPDEAPVLRAAIRTATKRGVVIVAAAGNGGSTDRTFPAADPGVIGVAATTSSDSLFDWSNRGPWVSIAAPGETATTLRGGGYTTFLGTSAAAPAVAAAAAECLSVAPQLGPAAVRRILMQTADPVAGMTFGRLNVARAVDACSKA